MASRGVNKVILIGRVGQDPDIHTFQNGDQVANLSLATSETWQDKQTGEAREKTEWHRCVAYRGLAVVIGKYIKKGSKIYIEGRLQTRKWQDKNGQDNYTTEVIINEMQMLDTRKQSNDAAPPQQQQPEKSKKSTSASQYQAATSGANATDSFDDDDMPF